MDNESSLDKMTTKLQVLIRRITERNFYSVDATDESADEEDVNNWEDEIAEELAKFHQAAMILGNNGELDENQYSLLIQKISDQLAYLKQFANQLRENARAGQLVTNPPDVKLPTYMSPAQIFARADMYGNAIRSSYFNGTTKGLPLPAMPGEGTQCFTNCKCSWQINTIDEAKGDHDCFWKRSVKDSCQTCIIREQEWSPLRIRNGLIEL